IRGSVEVSREIFDGAEVTIDGSLGVITTLEFFQHHFSKMGHRDLLVTQNLSHPTSNQCSAHLTRSVRRRAASFKSGCEKLLEAFTLTLCWGTSALDDRFEVLGFEVVARIGGGLRVGVGTNLNAMVLVSTGCPMH